MSTKIYNAYEVTGLKNNRADTIMNFVQSILNELRPHIKKEWNEMISKNSISELDRYHVKGIIPKERDRYFDNKWREEWKWYNGEIAIFPRKNKVYMIHYFTDNIWKIIDEKKYGLVDFHYQNSSDKPDDISNYEWNKRRKIWDEFFRKGVPAQTAFCVNAFVEHDMPFGMYKDIIEYQPSFEKRLYSFCFDKEVFDIIDADPELKEDWQNKHNFYPMHVAMCKIKDENIDVVSKHRHLFEDKLPKQYSQEDMVKIYELWDKHNKELANQPV